MCGIIGFIPKKDNVAARKLLFQLILQSEIRGRHATGISWVDAEQNLHTLKEPVSARDFLSRPEVQKVLLDTSNKAYIAHTRYSTSGDFKNNDNNQPIQFGNCAVAHNGVITQESPQTWKEKYGVDPITGNDSELLLTSSNLACLPENGASISALYLTHLQVYAYTNGLRPLWRAECLDSQFMFSTIDIWARSLKAINEPFVSPVGLLCQSFEI